jgi:hypothetical protein
MVDLTGLQTRTFIVRFLGRIELRTIDEPALAR